ncbi:MAG: hypothetical protein J7521_21840 [Caulobacter sp.]|nr:hypothetical protein [Caulobacter sp.]
MIGRARKGALLSWLAACGLALSFASAGQAAQPEPRAKPFDATTNPALSGWVEDNLQAMMTQCIGGELTMLRKKSFGGHDVVSVSAIPPIIRDGLNLTANPKIQLQKGSTLTREFGYVRPDTTGAAFDESDSNALALNYANFQDQLPAVGVNQTNYVATCSTVLSSKATLDGDYSFPMATVKAGLDADYDTSASTSLSLVSGHFESPIVAMYQGVGVDGFSPADSAYAALLFWNWYTRNSTRISADNYILRYFDGVSIYKISGLKKRTRIDVNLSAQFSVPTTSVSTTNTLGVSQMTTASASDYAAAVLLRPDGSANRQYFPLPKLDELRSVVAARSEVLFDRAGSDDLMLLTSSKKISLVAFSIPKVLCNGSLWATDDSRVVVTDAAQGVQPGSAGAPDRAICRFSLVYTPTAGDMLSGTQLKFSLTSKTTLGAGSPLPIKVPAPQIAYQGTRRPSLEYVSGGPVPVSATPIPGPAPSTQLAWRISYRLVTDANARLLTTDNMDTTNLVLTCPSSAPISAAPTFTVSFDGPQSGNTRNLSIQVAAVYAGPAPDLTRMDGLASCALGGSIDYLLAGLSTPVTRSAPSVPLAYPRTLAQSPAQPR